MVEQPLNLTRLKSNYKIILIVALSLILLLLFLTLKKVFFLLTTTTASIIVSIIIGVFSPMKISGIELVTFSTIIVGNFFGSFVGAVFGVSLLIIHLIAARYQGGPYIAWTLPIYAIIGILSGFVTDANTLVGMVVAVNVLDNLLTLALYRENYMKTLIFSIGNVIFNSILILKFYGTITGLIV